MAERGSQILLVEDEPVLAEGIAANLRAEGHRVSIAQDGEDALARLRGGGFDAMVLDIMLPRLDGWQVCQRARAEGIWLPILFLSAKNSEADRVRGLLAGGDDYLGKPFALAELLARVAALLRRQRWQGAPAAAGLSLGPRQLTLAGHRIDFVRHLWFPAGASAPAEPVPAKELAILRLLAHKAPEVVSREQILQGVWGDDVYPSSRTIDNFVVRLRRRLEPDPQAPKHLHTVRGVGYRLTLVPAGVGEAAPAAPGR